ncbi:NUDIX hydrolase [Bailinhaonella thermotolerans]|uniref:NUDIX domain-containing protein n=1 Tax=Bailinhaonella thermotolerans TaxID=1070861 RepID=A0A3A4BQQ6_9ACTN|nr:NUDIX hydrolase [Bailinhaonella thermotolerans]RJL33476.1 NUDIX domain-containing protein [Bailinhaonella thermotolerans]
MRMRCVGAVVHDDSRRLLLIKRANPPGQGLWSLPGGRVEPGETDSEALIREMREETGLEIEVGDLVGRVDVPGASGIVYDIHDYAATPTGGTLRPGDDALETRWVTAEDLHHLPLAPGLLTALTTWHALPS